MLQKEFVKVSDDGVDRPGLKKIRKIHQKLELVKTKYEEVLAFQETLRYMLDRDLKSVMK